MNYSETIDYLFSRLPMFSRIGAAAYKKDLTNTILLCEALENPQTKFRSVHIAGTNGKGSVSHMLAGILQTAGYKTGLYTSPHLKDFRERIRINGRMVSEDFVIDFTRRMKPLIEKTEPSFFEITVAMAFEYFAEEKVDIAIIETGLGGRLDSTNIISPEVSVITNISFDHMNMLGDTLDKIATEKAGIIKKQVPVVIGETSAETSGIFINKANAENAPLIFADKERWIPSWSYEHHLLGVTVANHENDERENYQLDLPGIYQTKNLLTVLETVDQLKQKGFFIDTKTTREALKYIKKLTGLHGRWEVIHSNPAVILDVAHNEAGIKQLLSQLEITDHEQLHIIIGMVKDKDIGTVLQLLPKQANYYFTRSHIPRALPEQELLLKAAEHQLHGNTFENVNLAIHSALGKAGKKDLVLVCGSVFLIGEVEGL